MDEWTYKEIMALNNKIESIESILIELVDQLEKKKLIEAKK